MKNSASLLRVLAAQLISFVLFEVTLESDGQWAIEKYPVIWAVLGIILLISIAIEIAIHALNNVLFQSLDDAAKERYLAAQAAKKTTQFSGIKRLYKKLLDSKPVEEEHEIILDHDYDGIKELDNNLPPWWLYGFYFTILFGIVYMVRYHVFDGPDQTTEYEMEVAEAQKAIEAYKLTAKDLVDVNSVVALTESSDLAAGKAIFEQNCVACHKSDGGGGIGPNLTDPYWILGGGIKNIFRTISEGGRDGKGMISWKQTLKPSEMAQVASYILTFEGTTPAEPKEAQGNLWVDPEATQDEAPIEETPEPENEKVTDSTTVAMK